MRTPRTAHIPRRSALVLGVAALPLLLAGCGQDAAPDAAPDAAAAADGSGPGEGPCPAGLTTDGLTGAVPLGSADIDGDGAMDEVVMGGVSDAGAGCAVALLVTTATGTLSAPVAGATEPVGETALGPPVFAQVDGVGGQEIVVPVSWNPRGGGELGMFSFVDGELVQVRQDGRPWTVLATVDDGGGAPQLLTCTEDGGFLHVTTPDPRATVSEITAYGLEDGVITELTGDAADAVLPDLIRDTYPGLPQAGLLTFPDCG